MSFDDAVAMGVVDVVTVACLAYAAASAMRSRGEMLPDGGQVLRYPMLLRIGCGISGLLFSVLLAAAPFWASDEMKTPEALALVGLPWIVLLGMFVYATLEFPFVWIVHDAGGVTGFAPWRKTRVIAWSDVRSVEFSVSSQWFIIKGHDGATIRASLYLSGIRQLHDALHVHVPREYWKSDHAAFHVA